VAKTKVTINTEESEDEMRIFALYIFCRGLQDRAITLLSDSGWPDVAGEESVPCPLDVSDSIGFRYAKL
jgi:hypothetical protein